MPEPRRRLRIAQLTPTYFDRDSVLGGGERYVYNLAEAVCAADSPAWHFDQTIIALGRAERRLTHAGLPVQVLCNENPSANAMAGVSGQLWAALADFDLVHVHQSLTGFGGFASVVAKSLGRKLVLTDHGGGSNTVMTTGRGVELADGMVSVSRYARSLIEAKYHGPHIVLTGPVDCSHFAPQPGLAGNGRTVIAVGRMLPHKGLDRIIAALPPGLQLRLVGQAPDAAYLTLLHRLARGKEVAFIHDADDAALVRLYATSDLFVQASTLRDIHGRLAVRPELMGIATMEAMASGLPVLVSNAGSLPELVADPAWGLVFADDDQLAARLLAFRDRAWPDPGAGAQARAHAMARHGLAAIGQRIGDFYAAVAG